MKFHIFKKLRLTISGTLLFVPIQFQIDVYDGIERLVGVGDILCVVRTLFWYKVMISARYLEVV